jgi:hypothetical protein
MLFACLMLFVVGILVALFLVWKRGYDSEVTISPGYFRRAGQALPWKADGCLRLLWL